MKTKIKWIFLNIHIINSELFEYFIEFTSQLL